MEAMVVLLVLSVALLVFHIGLQGMLATRELGAQWNAGPRDEARAPSGVLAGRAARASANFRETYPGFVALAAPSTASPRQSRAAQLRPGSHR